MTINKKKILIVDDDKNICKLIDLYLKDAGFLTVLSYPFCIIMDHISFRPSLLLP